MNFSGTVCYTEEFVYYFFDTAAKNGSTYSFRTKKKYFFKKQKGVYGIFQLFLKEKVTDYYSGFYFLLFKTSEIAELLQTRSGVRGRRSPWKRQLRARSLIFGRIQKSQNQNPNTFFPKPSI